MPLTSRIASLLSTPIEGNNKQWEYLPVYDSLRYTNLANGSLAIANVSQREQGFYLCSAANGFGPEVTKLIKITIHGEYWWLVSRWSC